MTQKQKLQNCRDGTSQGMPAATKSCERQGEGPPRASGHLGFDSVISNLRPPELWEDKFLLF